MIVANAFSLNMLSGMFDMGMEANIAVQPISASGARELAGEAPQWAIGHADTSRVVSAMLGIEDPGSQRVSLDLIDGDRILVAQYTGPRLPEGATELPEGARINWLLVEVG